MLPNSSWYSIIFKHAVRKLLHWQNTRKVVSTNWNSNLAHFTLEGRGLEQVLGQTVPKKSNRSVALMFITNIFKHGMQPSSPTVALKPCSVVKERTGLIKQFLCP